MAKGKLEVPYPVPKEQLKAFSLRLRYGRRLGSREVFEVDYPLFEQLCKQGFASVALLDSRTPSSVKLPDFVLLAAQLLPNVYDVGLRMSRLAVLTLRVRRKLPPYVSTQRYLVGDSVMAVLSDYKLPKRSRAPKEPIRTRGRRLVSREG